MTARDLRTLSRRGWLARAIGALGAAAAAALGGCDRIAESPGANQILAHEERWNRAAQRWLLGRDALAVEYPESAISRDFRSNGSTTPGTDEYNRMAAAGFADWRLSVGGLVERPLTLSLAELRTLPSRTQITRHDCVEGWSCIAKWKGARLAALLDRAGLRARARYIAFFCADTLEITLDGTGQYYETIDLVDAYHPQTILAYEMNGEPLPVPYGAPLRLRVERQLGYKMAKYIMRIEAVESFAAIARGKGGFWEDRGYAWYAGI
ncbi:MAG TPA: molybdopterin-binding protein [Steroidobacteraceae bacterium]|nr:molybdopterin-binding protein [Steroidobacteraceae bacterium]